ncbi:MAG: helix-turn-helix domain-containing protein [Burkholderiaceae bacterium]|jgi:transcriptional regulator GlxA family with amidase domain|nr:helix-turn-helix domain-containing protein [Burkholderiaceae bacterium]
MADPTRSPPVHVALLGAADTTASTLYGFLDTLSGVCRDWETVHGRSAVSPFSPQVVSRDGVPFVAANGVRISPDASFATVAPPDIVCITDLAVPPGERLGERYDAEVRWIREQHAHGALIASACSGALLLARTGLLDGLDATSHWAYCDALRREYPATRWHPERGLVLAGTGQRIMMAGSGVAWHQLVLALVARHAGAQAAMELARINLLDWNATSPLAYASLTQGAQVADPVVQRCQQWAASNYQVESPVRQLVALSGLPERTFKRRFAQATGMSPLEYVHTLRLEEAKQMLEAGDEPVEAIAWEVGYQDASFFARLFRRRVSLTPAQYRRRFGGLKRRIEHVAPGDAGLRDAAAAAGPMC